MHQEMLSGKEGEPKRYDPVKIQQWVAAHLSPSYIPKEVSGHLASSNHELTEAEKVEMMKSINPRHQTVSEKETDYLKHLFTANWANGEITPLSLVNELNNYGDNYSAKSFLSPEDLSDVIKLVSPFFLRENIEPSQGQIFSVYDFDKENIIGGREFVESGRLFEFLDSPVRKEILEIVLKKLPATHCMKNNKPLKLVNNELTDFATFDSKYSLSIPCNADYETIGRNKLEFTNGFRTSVHLSPVPVLGHMYGEWESSDKMIVIPSMYDLYKLNQGNAELRSINGVDMQFVVSQEGLKIPNNSTVFLLNQKASLTNYQEAAAEKLGLNITYSNLTREEAFESVVGKDKANGININIADSMWGWDMKFGDTMSTLTGISNSPHDGSQNERFDDTAKNILLGNSISSHELITILEASPIQLEWLNKVIKHVDKLKK